MNEVNVDHNFSTILVPCELEFHVQFLRRDQVSEKQTTNYNTSISIYSRAEGE